MGWISGCVYVHSYKLKGFKKKTLYWLSQSGQGREREKKRLTKHSVFLVMCGRGQWSWFGEGLGHAALPLTSWLVGGMLPWQRCLRPRPRCHSHLLLHLVLQELQLHIKKKKTLSLCLWRYSLLSQTVIANKLSESLGFTVGWMHNMQKKAHVPRKSSVVYFNIHFNCKPWCLPTLNVHSHASWMIKKLSSLYTATVRGDVS